MENRLHESKLEAYFSGQMTAPERAAFEAEVRQDETLKRDFQAYYLTLASVHLGAQQRHRVIAEKVRAEMGPLRKPRLSVWMLPPIPAQWRAAAAVFVLAIAVVGFWASQVPSLSEVETDYFQKPASAVTAGGSEQSQTLFDKSSAFYWKNTPSAADSLSNLCADFCVADYFLAHLYLKNKNYQAAEQAFQLTLQNWDSLAANHEDIQNRCKVEINYLLAKLGSTGDAKSILPEVDALLQNQALCNGDARKDVEQLKSDLTHPLRFLKFN
jgi:hypothetical protein